MHYTDPAAFSAALHARAEACKAQEEQLNRDGRSDEAVFARIAGNIFDMAHTVCDAGCRVMGGDPEKTRSFLEGKLRGMRQSWAQSLDQACSHDDGEKAHIESVKIQVIDEILDALTKEA